MTMSSGEFTLLLGRKRLIRHQLTSTSYEEMYHLVGKQNFLRSKLLHRYDMNCQLYFLDILQNLQFFLKCKVVACTSHLLHFSPSLFTLVRGHIYRRNWYRIKMLSLSLSFHDFYSFSVQGLKEKGVQVYERNVEEALALTFAKKYFYTGCSILTWKNYE